MEQELNIERLPDTEFDWLAERARSQEPRVHRVEELLLPGYEAYLRLFHPILTIDGLPHPPSRGGRLTWRKLADAAGVAFGPHLSPWQISGQLRSADGSHEYGCDMGELDPLTWVELLTCLRRHSSGRLLYGWAPPNVPRPGHRLVLAAQEEVPLATLQAHARSLLRIPGWGPECVWPEDRAWVVCTDYDLVSSYLAVSSAAASDLMENTSLELTPVTLRHRVDNRMHEEAA